MAQILRTIRSDRKRELPQGRNLRGHAQKHDDRRGGRKKRSHDRPDRVRIVDHQQNQRKAEPGGRRRPAACTSAAPARFRRWRRGPRKANCRADSRAGSRPEKECPPSMRSGPRYSPVSMAAAKGDERSVPAASQMAICVRPRRPRRSVCRPAGRRAWPWPASPQRCARSFPE